MIRHIIPKKRHRKNNLKNQQKNKPQKKFLFKNNLNLAKINYNKMKMKMSCKKYRHKSSKTIFNLRSKIRDLFYRRGYFQKNIKKKSFLILEKK